METKKHKNKTFEQEYDYLCTQNDIENEVHFLNKCHIITLSRFRTMNHKKESSSLTGGT